MLLVASGHSNKSIAAMLKCAYKTIEKHKQSIYYKWHVDSTLAMVRVGLRSGELSITDFLASKIGENCHHAMPHYFERIKI